MSGDGISKMALGPENPWPGLNQFVEAHDKYFHGRDEEKAELFRLVKYETLTTLFGRSGLGKSSLLQAGLFPLLRQSGYLPVFLHIRHDDVSGDGAEAAPLVAQVYASLREACAASNVEAPEFREGETLWEYFHRAGAAFWDERNRLRTPVLVFDQFEEAFTLGAETSARRQRRDAFFLQLEELIENRPPQTLRERWDRDPELVAQFEEDRTPCKIVLSLREDFLPDLEQLKGRIRSIMGNRFRLERMDGTKAWQVVMGNRGELQLMEEDVALKIIDFVSRTRAGRDELPLARENLRGRTVDPALLSVVCSELNNRRRARHEQKISFTLVSDSKEEIIREFFDTHVNGLGPGAGATRRFIEEELITEGEGYRKRCALEEEMLRQKNVSREDLRKLEQQRILRFEPSEGITWIELTHDLLTGVVRQSRSERRAREEKEAAEKKAIAERERIEGEQRERRKRARTIVALGAAAVLVLVAGVVALIFNNERNRANDEAKRANDEAVAADYYRVRSATAKIQSELSEVPPNVARARLMADYASTYPKGYPFSPAVAMLGESPYFAPAKTIDYDFELAQAAFSSDGRCLGILDKDGNFWVRKTDGDLSLKETGQVPQGGAAKVQRANPEEKKIAGFCFHPRGKSIVALRPLGEDKVVFYDYEKHAEVPTAEIEIRAVVPELDEKELEGFKKAAGAAGIAFSPDGTLLAFAASNSIVCVYSVADVTTVDGTRKSPVAWTGAKGGKDETKPRPVKPATGVVFIWAGTVAQIVTTNDEGVWVWPDEREKGKKVEGEMHYERFVTRGSSRDSSAGNETSIATPAGGVGLCIAPFGDGSNGVVFRDAKVWTELLGKVVTNDQSPLELPGQTTALACSPDGLLVAAGVGKDGIYIYRQSELIQRIQTGDAVQSLSFRSDGKFLAAILGKEGGSSEKEGGSSGKAGGSSSKLAFFQLTMHGMAALAKRPIIAEQIAISPNGLWLATVEDKGADGERIRLCSASTGEVIKETPVKISSVAALTVSDAGRVRAFSRNELWDVFGSEEPKPMEIGRTFAVSGDAQWLVRPGKDGALEVMQLPGGESKPAVAVSEKGDPQQQVAQEPAPIRRNVRARAYRSTFAFSHTGKVFAAHKPTAGRIDLCANPWLKPPPQSSYIPCAKPLRAMAFALDDHLLFAATLDGNLLVFDLTMGKQCFVRRANGAVLAMATSLKPPVLGVAMADQPLRLWGAVADQEELKTVAGAYPVELDWNELSDDQKKAQRDKPLEPVDERTAAFWDAFWKTGRAVQQLKETASVAELEAAYAPLRAVLSDEGAPDSSWQMKAMRERLRFWKLLAPSAARSKEDLERLSAALPRLEAMEQEIVKRSGILPGTEAATSPAPGGR